MGGVGFSSKGKSFEDIVKELDAAFSYGRFIRILREAAQVAFKKAWDLCPVATGKMRTSIYYEMDANSFILICDCPYAEYNEYGWSGIPPVPKPPKYTHYKGGYRPFMRIGMIKGEKYFEREVQKWLKKRLKGR